MEFRPKALARFSLTLAGVFVAPLPSAEPSGMKVAAKKPFDPQFVKPTAVDGAQVLPPPPEPGALAARADLEAGWPMQAWRAPAQVAWAQRVGQNDPFRFADVLGAWFAKANLPLTTAFLKDVDEDRHEITEVAKKRSRGRGRGWSMCGCSAVWANRATTPTRAAAPRRFSRGPACWWRFFRRSGPSCLSLPIARRGAAWMRACIFRATGWAAGCWPNRSSRN